MSLNPNAPAATFAIAATVYFWWQNIKGISESSEKALWIMQLTTVMVVALIGWCAYTLLVRGVPSAARAVAAKHRADKHTLWDGWRAATFRKCSLCGRVRRAGPLGTGHERRGIPCPGIPRNRASQAAQSEKGGVRNFHLQHDIHVAGVVFRGDDHPGWTRPKYFENLIGGLAMSLTGPFVARLAFHVFVVVVGTLILSGAVNTAIVGSNGVLNRVSEDGVLPDWFRQPHPKFGTSYRIINIVVMLQMVMILISRGDVTFLGEPLCVRRDLEFRSERHCSFRAAVHAASGTRVQGSAEFQDCGKRNACRRGAHHADSSVNCDSEPVHKAGGDSIGHHFLRGALYRLRAFGKEDTKARRGGEAHVELDQFNLAQAADLTQENVGVKPGNMLVPVSTQYALYPLEAALRRATRGAAEIVVLHVRMLRRGAVGEYDLEPEQLFSTIEQLLFTKVLAIAEKEGKPVRLAVAAANDLWEGVLRTAENLQSSAIVVGSSSRSSVSEHALEIGLAWERMPEPRPRVALEIFTPSGQEQIFYLGPHAPRLTPKEIDLLHCIWLELGQQLPGIEIHHHDIVHFALTEVERELGAPDNRDVFNRLREHLQDIQDRRQNP